MSGSRSSAAIFVDTDIGCDDAVAIAWLLRQPDVSIVGFSTVYGNSSVQHTTANLISLLHALEADVPVTSGASAPLVYPRTSSGALVHGPDGLWGAQRPVDISRIDQSAPGAIAAAAREYPDLTLIALGPLTNIARAIQAYPDDLADVRVVVLGGAKGSGNVTPVAEFNIFADPHALAIVLESRVRLELVTLNAFEQVRVDGASFSERLASAGGPVGELLAHAFGGYTMAQTRGAGGSVAIPDVAAVIYALHPQLGEAAPATVRVVVDGDLTRGQTIIATSFNHQIALGLGAGGIARLADQLGTPGFNLEAAIGDALGRAGHNAQVILSVDGAAMVRMLEETLLMPIEARAVGS